MIEVTDGVYWNPDTIEQSEEAMQWLNEEVRSNLGEATKDRFLRNDERTYENERVVVVEKQLYINENTDWARRGVQYTVTSKEVNNEAV